jgi:senataxin
VDQAQGSEADIIILSCVRCNSDNSIGFVENPNRMNVAISRAKEQIISIGSVKTMQR